MDAAAVVLEKPGQVALRALAPMSPGPDDFVVRSRWSGISSGTEKLLWTGRMPVFPGMGYPLVPGYETVGEVIDAGANARGRIGEQVFVPGATCWKDARSLFGGSASLLVAPSARVSRLPDGLGAAGVLVALAATAHHALAGGPAPELVVGHGVLGRLLVRLILARGGAAPTVWERNPARRDAAGYAVLDPEADERRNYCTVLDASGDPAILDTLIGRLTRGGEIVLAGFYEAPLRFAFPPAFIREARIRIAAEFLPGDVAAVLALVGRGALSLDGLVSHIRPASAAGDAYGQAFEDPACLKMALDWRDAA